MNGSYEFIVYLNRIKTAYGRFQTAIWVLNAAIISISLYAFALLLGLPAFTKYYWLDFLPLALSPAILSVILGAIGATLIRRRNRSDLFGLLGPQLSEKARTACDNRNAKSLPMQKLAEELKASLSKIRPSEILKWRQINIRAALAVVLAGATVFLAQSQISADITPSDFQSLSDLRDRALDLFQNETPSQPAQVNLSGNIYGKPSLAVLNEEKLELMLYPGIGAGSRSRSAESVDRLFQQSQAEEVTAVPSELYIESLPPQNKEIIKRYFEILAEG
ncbi:MAG TPA: hypothetical protein VLB04_09095 [Methanotrichaceae archaeon]|nr:hypothetical protein [Methanotrichaceae archaeon]